LIFSILRSTVICQELSCSLIFWKPLLWTVRTALITVRGLFFFFNNCSSNTGGHIFIYLSKEGKSMMQDPATEAIASRPRSQSCFAAKPVASQACLLPS
jgi:hypothetical protein